MVAVVVGSFRMNIAGSTTIEGSLDVDGASETAIAFASGAIYGNISQTWVVTLATAGSHTLKLRGLRLTGTTALIMVDDSTITLVSLTGR